MNTLFRKYVLLFVGISLCLATPILGQTNKLLWKITGNGLEKPSYLYGTIHVRDSRAFKFSDSVMIALENSEVFAIEVHPDSLSKMTSIALTEGLYEKMDSVRQTKPKDSTNEQIYRPELLKYAWKEILSKKEEKKVFVDAYLLGVANSLKKEVLGLESINNQLEVLRNPEESLKRGKQSLPVYAWIEMYESGDLEKMEEVIGKEALEGKVYKDRNIDMANSMDTVMKGGRSLFAAVGSGHLVGKYGIPNLLRKKGYQVEFVPAVFTGYADKYKNDIFLPGWRDFVDKKGAYRIRIPATAQKIPSQAFEYGEQGSSEETMHLYVSLDLSSMTNCLVGYEDYETGFNMDNKEDVFRYLLEETEEDWKAVGEIDTLEYQGFEARERDFIIKGMSKARFRVILRGNRIYRIIYQELTLNGGMANVDDFFNSLEFLPYDTIPLTSKKPEGEDFEVPAFSTYYEFPDSTDNFFAKYIDDLTSYSTRSELSGAAFNTSVYDFKPFYYVAQEDSFLKELKETFVAEEDSIIKERDIVEGGIKKKELVFMESNNHLVKRYRFWLQGGRLFFMHSYTGSEESMGAMDNLYFDSFKWIGDQAEGNEELLKPKFDEWEKALQSSNKENWQEAKLAINYLKFKKEDLPNLFGLLNNSYADDSSYYGIRDLLIDKIFELDSIPPAKLIREAYYMEKLSDDLKSRLLSNLFNYRSKDIEANVQLGMELLKEAPPLDPSSTWSTLTPYSRNPAWIERDKEFLFGLMDKAIYRNTILYLFQDAFQKNIWNRDSLPQETIDNILKYAKVDLDSAKNLLEKEGELFTLGVRPYNYFDLFLVMGKQKIGEEFATYFLGNTLNRYLSSQSLKYLLTYGYPVSDSTIRAHFEEESLRYEAYLPLIKNGLEDRIPESYRSVEEFGKSFINNSIYEDEYSFSTVEVITDTYIRKKRILIMTYQFVGEEEKHLAAAGPFGDELSSTDLEKLKYNYRYEAYEEGNQKQIQEILKSLFEWIEEKE
ncbi:MAG: TraB/GumN family protein [Bacteroidia bacterium]|nr:TraB/GumN family protein [Bacteroidia bacterium]